MRTSCAYTPRLRDGLVRGYAGEYRPVLVDVGQLPKNEQEVDVVAVRSFMRLNLLDHCEQVPVTIQTCEGTPQLAPCGKNDTAKEVVPIGVDRKRRPFGDLGDRCTDQMVERGAQALDEVAAEDAQARRRLAVDRYVDRVAASVVIRLGPVAVGFAIEENADLVLEYFQMLVRPVELGPDAVLGSQVHPLRSL